MNNLYSVPANFFRSYRHNIFIPGVPGFSKTTLEIPKDVQKPPKTSEVFRNLHKTVDACENSPDISSPSPRTCISKYDFTPSAFYLNKESIIIYT